MTVPAETGLSTEMATVEPDSFVPVTTCEFTVVGVVTESIETEVTVLIVKVLLEALSLVLPAVAAPFVVDTEASPSEYPVSVAS